MTFGAVVALTRLDILVCTVHQHRAATFDDVDKFAISCVGVLANRRTAVEQALHNLAFIVHISAYDKLFLATVEMFEHLFCALFEIDNHSVNAF
jgi:hypothetical protein